MRDVGGLKYQEMRLERLAKVRSVKFSVIFFFEM